MDPAPEPPEFHWLDTPSGGLELNRDDSVDVVLYLQDLEAWVKATRQRCK